MILQDRVCKELELSTFILVYFIINCLVHEWFYKHLVG